MGCETPRDVRLCRYLERECSGTFEVSHVLRRNPSGSHPENGVIEEIAGRLDAQFGSAPNTLVVLGSGLGAVVERMDVEHEASTVSLGLPQSLVEGHAGQVVCGDLAGSRLAVLSGRVHMYEGHPAPTLVRYVRAAWFWGVQRLLLTCSAGGITENLDPGDLVVISDHINFMNDNPLRGKSWGGNRFPDMTHGYSQRMRKIVRECVADAGIPFKEGVYAAMNGPAYETPAEIRMLRTIGADMVGMSTVPEVLAANEVGMEVMAIAAISNRAAGLSTEPLTHDDVQLVAGVASENLSLILGRACPKF